MKWWLVRLVSHRHEQLMERIHHGLEHVAGGRVFGNDVPEQEGADAVMHVDDHDTNDKVESVV